MNERYDGYAGDRHEDQYQLVGYDPQGRPVYRQVPSQPPGHAPHPTHGAPSSPYGQQDPYGYGNPAPRPSEEHGWYGQPGQQPVVPPQDPYGAAQQPVIPAQDTGAPHDGRGWYPSGASPADFHGPQGTGQQPVVPPQDPYGTGQQPVVPPQDPYGTGQHAVVPPRDPYGGDGRQDGAAGEAQSGPYGAGDQRDGSGGSQYRPEQFSFVEESAEDSEDVIDWLKFTESRTERREEARRRARNRLVALMVVLALALVGGVGYLWQAGKLPALPGSDPGAGSSRESGPQNRDVIVVHLHNTKRGGTSTALLVDNTTTKRGATVLLPNALSLTSEDGTATTLGKSVDEDGSTDTRGSIDGLLGTRIQGTWRLDTPYLDNLVELVGTIDVTTDTDVPDPEDKKASKKGGGTPGPLVKKGENQTLSGRMAVAYATYRAPGEPDTAQLRRFGQVMQAVLRKMPSDPHSATVTIQTLAQILDPSLTDKDLGAFLAKLADRAKGGDYQTRLLPVQQGGTLSPQARDGIVKDVLGGTVRPPEKDAAVRVGVRNATGAKDATEAARVTLVNGGYTFVGGSPDDPRQTSTVIYADPARKKDAMEVAKTLGLATSAVRKGDVPGNTDVSVVLGADYDREGPDSGDRS